MWVRPGCRLWMCLYLTQIPDTEVKQPVISDLLQFYSVPKIVRINVGS